MDNGGKAGTEVKLECFFWKWIYILERHIPLHTTDTPDNVNNKRLHEYGSHLYTLFDLMGFLGIYMTSSLQEVNVYCSSWTKMGL